MQGLCTAVRYRAPDPAFRCKPANPLAGFTTATRVIAAFRFNPAAHWRQTLFSKIFIAVKLLTFTI